MNARVVVICCEADPGLLDACAALIAGLRTGGADPALRALPGRGTPSCTALDPHELLAAAGIVFATAGRTTTLASDAADLLAATGPFWSGRLLEDRIVSGFTTAHGPAGERVLAGLLRAACHWGSVLLPQPRPGVASATELHGRGVRIATLAARVIAPTTAGLSAPGTTEKTSLRTETQ